MRSRVFPVALAAASLLIGAVASAQFGHPLKGSWSGDWGPDRTTRTRVLIEIQWDGKTLSGAINPGPTGARLPVATLNPDTWGVHLEADGRDRSGKTVHYVIDGKVENIGAYQRFITGTWREGSTQGDFRVTRN